MAGADLSWFNPVPTQEEFVRTFARETIYAGGVGSGKTLSGGVKCLLASMLWPGGVGLVGRQTYGALSDTTQKVLIEGDDKPPIFDDSLGRYVAGDRTFEMKNGSTILFRSLEDHNIEKLLSLNLAWFYIDEVTETTERVWLTLLGRLRHPAGPRAAWATTNPNGHDWVWKRFHPDAGVADDNRKIFLQPTMSNPHLPPDYIEMLMGMPSEWKKRFVYCSFDTAAGMIWDMWDSSIHAYDHEVTGRFPAYWKRFESMDHGRRNPTAWLFFTVDPDGFVIVEDEYYVEGLLPSQHAPAIRAQRQIVAPNITWGGCIAPPDVFRLGNDGRSVADEYRDAAEILLIQGNDNVDAGLLRVAEWMQRDPSLEFPSWHHYGGTKGPDGLGSPRLFVSRRCTSLIGEIPDYRWKDLSPAQERDRDQPEQPRKKDDHAVDALRYGLMSRPRPYVTFSDEMIAKKETRRQRSYAETRGLVDKVF